MAIAADYSVVLLSDKRHEGYDKRAINLTGRLDLEEYVGVVAICDVGLGADSSLIHIAGILERQAIGLFGSVDPKLRIAHYDSVIPMQSGIGCSPCNDGQLDDCTKREEPYPACMYRLVPEMVLERIKSIL